VVHHSFQRRNTDNKNAGHDGQQWQSRPYSFKADFNTFSPRFFRFALGNTKTLPRPFARRTEGIFCDKSTFSMQFFTLSIYCRVWNGKRRIDAKKAGTRQVLRLLRPCSALCGFPLALVLRTLDNDNAERLFALAAAFPAKGVILPPSVLAQVIPVNKIFE